MGKQADVTLTVKARNEAEATLLKTVSALKESARALDEFNASAKKQNRTTAELRAEQEKLNAALAELSSARAGASGLKALQQEAARLEKQFVEARTELERLAKANAATASKAEGATKAQEAALERQRRKVKDLAAEQEKLNKIIASAPTNLDRKVSARELTLQRAASGVGSQISSREAVIAARQAALEETKKVNAASKFGALVEKEVALRKAAVAAAQQETAAVQALATAQQKANAATAKAAQHPRPAAPAGGAGGSKNDDFKAQRTALDLSQRLRGQVLALTSTYVGLFGVLNQVNTALEEQRKLTSVRARISVAFDTTDTKLIGEELAFVRAEADRLKLNFLQLADSYSSFAAAAKLAGASSAEVRTVFSALAESSRALGLSTQQVERIFTAVEQIYSKTIVSTEELKGQLGESLSGAFEAFAKNTGRSAKELTEALQKGEVQASEFLGFIVKYAENAAKGLPAQLESMGAAIDAFGNTTADLRKQFADGLEPGMKDAINELSAALKDPAIQAEVRKLGEAFGDLAKWLVENREAVIAVVEAVAGFVAFKTAQSLVVGLVGQLVGAYTAAKNAKKGFDLLSDGMIVLNSYAPKLTTALKGLGVAAAGFTIGYGIGAWLRDTFEWARKLGVGIAEVSVKMALLAKRASGSLSAEQYAAELEKANATLKDMYKDAELSDEQHARAAEAAAAARQKEKEAAAEQKRIDDEAAALREANMRNLEETKNRIQSELSSARLSDEEKKVAEIEAKYKSLAAEANRSLSVLKLTPNADPSLVASQEKQTAGLLAQIEREKGDQIAAIRQEYREKEAKKSQEEAERQQREAKQNADAIKRIEDGALQATADTMDEKVALIATKYAELRAELQALDVAPVDEARISALLAEAEKMEVQTLRVADAEKKLNDTIAARDQYVQTVGARVTAGQVSEAEGAELVRQKYAATKDEVIRLADELMKLPGITEAQRLALEQVKIEAAGASDAQQQMAMTGAEVAQAIAGGLTNAIDGFVAGTMTAGEAMRAFFSDLLRQIALAIIKQTILNALTAAGGAPGIAAGVFHSGGMIGNTRGNRTSRVNPAVFIGAPRYHTGGMAGLAPNEVPAILQRGEEVLAKSDPRNAANGGASPSAAPQTPQNIQVVNTIDPASLQQAVFGGGGAVKQILNVVQANKRAFKQALI